MWRSETQEPCNSPGTPHRSHKTEGKAANCIGSSLTLPECYLPTSTEDETIC